MKKKLALAIALLCVAAALANLRPLWRDFDTVAVRLDMADAANSAGGRFDAVLLRNLEHLGYLRAFDHVFSAGARTARIAAPVWLDRCEVRQGDFNRFADWHLFNPQAPVAAPEQPPNWRYFSSSNDHAISGRLDGPANGITWYDAGAYCRAAGGRLPRVEEWIAAATGAQTRLYPWGDAFDARPWPYLDPLLNAARRCSEVPQTDTAIGLADMGQNVSEWASAPSAAAVMGGNAYNAPREIYSLGALYRVAPRDYRSPYLGFRCAYDQQPRETPWRVPADARQLPPGEYAVGVPADSRLPSLLASLPRDRVALIGRLFESGARSGSGEVHLTRREITRREYDAFLRDPFVAAGLHAEENQPKDHSHRPPDWDAQMRTPDLPAVNIDWWSAYAFASWAGGRLPTAEEWESAASGRGRSLYPWGDRFGDAKPITGERALGAPQIATADSGDISADGLLALGGNVSEWTRSVSTAAGSYAMIVKGGNFLLPGADTARFDYRNHLSPHYRSPTVGFRVAFERRR